MELVLYYSFKGHTREIAQKLAAERGADIVEVREARRRSMFTAVIPGCPNAMHRRGSKIEPIDRELSGYEEFTLCFPVWAGFPAPAFNSVLELLPKGAAVSLVLTSAGGETDKSRESTKAYIAEKGFTLTGYTDIRTAPEQQ